MTVTSHFQHTHTSTQERCVLLMYRQQQKFSLNISSLKTFCLPLIIKRCSIHYCTSLDWLQRIVSKNHHWANINTKSLHSTSYEPPSI